MTLREEYVEMRKLGQFNLNWFFRFYISEYKNFPDKVVSVIKGDFGNPIYEPNGIEGQYRQKVMEYDRRELSFSEFAQSFSMVLSIYSNEILEWCDCKMNIQKIEQKVSKKFELVETTEDKLIYIN